MLVRIAQSDAQLHNLHNEQHKYEQRTILLVRRHIDATHNTHIVHNIVQLCICAYIFHFLNNYAIYIVHVVQKVKNYAHFHNCTTNLHNANAQCVVLFIVLVCCA